WTCNGAIGRSRLVVPPSSVHSTSRNPESSEPALRPASGETSTPGRYPIPGLPWPRVVSRKGFLIALLVAGAFAAPAHAQPVELMPGVTYEKQVRFTLHGPVGVNVLVAPRPGGLYSFQPVLSNELIQGSEKLTAIEQRLAATT